MQSLPEEEVESNRANSNVVLEMDSPSTPPYIKLSQIERRRKALPSTTSESDRRSSSGWLATVNRRQQVLTTLQQLCKSKAIAASDVADGSTNKLTEAIFYELFSQGDVLKLLFQLFDSESEGKIPSSILLEFLNDNLREDGREFISLLDSAIYVVANENDLEFPLFSKIFNKKFVQEQMFLLIDVNRESSITLEALMDFIKDMTMPQMSERLSEEQLKYAEKIFASFTKEGHRELTLEDFKKLIPCKNPFFAERAFRLFDKDGSSTISSVEFRETLEQFSNQSVDDKIRFLFQIYDLDGDGVIQLKDLRAVLAACSEENGMKFSNEQLDQLASALFEDAENCDIDGEECHHQESGIGFEKLKAQMAKQPGLLDNLSTSLEKFLVPAMNPGQKKSRNTSSSSSTTSKFSRAYLRNNFILVSFLVAYLVVNVILFTTRAVQYRDKNFIYIVARASGQTLNFNCTFVVILMLRHCITWLRMKGLANILPLDNHVYLHKVCGITIVFLSFLHTLMHLINIPLNIADKLNSTATNETHTAIEWLFTTTPGMYGLIPGCACLTGWALVLVLAIMFIFSLPFVRKSGSFELFYWTHILYIPFWTILIFHGPHFWYWFIGPGTLFVVLEKMVQNLRRWSRKGRTFISSAVLLPSRVTHLTIKRPPNFHFHPGDYVYVQIPSLTNYEWHPFTISSAPELSDDLWLHVRCAGGWTNKLYEFIEERMAKMCCEQAFATGQPNCQRCTEILMSKTNARISRFKKLRKKALPEITAWIEEGANNDSVFVNTMNPNNEMMLPHNQHPSRAVRMPIPALDSPTETPVEESNGVFPTYFLRRRKSKRFIQSTPRVMFAPETLKTSSKKKSTNHEHENAARRVERFRKRKSHPSTTSLNRQNSHPNTDQTLLLDEPLEITIDGPYGAPSSHIFRAEHAVLIAAGIGVTPFASILQSIMNRYYAVRQTCPSCQHTWAAEMPDSIMNLKKVDFFWINRDQRSFEWFVNLLSQLEVQQAEMGGALERFLHLHMYITSALNKTDMKAVGLQMALDLLYAQEKRDLITGLKTRTNAGRPNWAKVFQKLQDEKKGKITVFYCGPPQLARELRELCDTFKFSFRKEIF